MNRFDIYSPGEMLKPYVKYIAVSENEDQNSYKILPGTSIVLGFQYRGSLSFESNGIQNPLSAFGITGLQDRFRIFKNSENVGTILVFFKETGASFFFRDPVNELFSESLSLDHFIRQSRLLEVQEKLAKASTDARRISIVEDFLISMMQLVNADLLVSSAIGHIHHSKGSIRIKQLAELLNISQSPLEKRFRRVVGASPKKFASIIRFQSLINEYSAGMHLTEAAYQWGYFDQAHFIKDFKLFTGETPEDFFRRKQAIL